MSLQRALELAAEADGRAYPKPTIGAVVVADGRVVGEGATETDGRHGEVVALAAAGEQARGATLYVTMEPCAHHGTTPPCVDAVLAAEIRRRRRGVARSQPGGGRRPRALARTGRRDRARGQLRGAPPERGVAHLGLAGPPVRHLQGGGHAGRPRHRARRALGLGRGVPPARPRAPRRLRRGRGRDGHRPAREPPARRARRRRARGSRAGSRSATGRSPRARSWSFAAARSRTSCARSPATASSHCCSREARRSHARFSRPGWSTSCCSSSRRGSRATGRWSSQAWSSRSA